jgi:hypothetical protein
MSLHPYIFAIRFILRFDWAIPSNILMASLP